MKSRNDPAMQRYREEYHRCCDDLVRQLRTEKGWSLEDFSRETGFREAFRTYSAQQARTTRDELREYAAGRNPNGYTETDVPGSLKKSVPRSSAATRYGLTGDHHHRYKCLDFRASICETSRHADSCVRKSDERAHDCTCDEIDAEIMCVLTEKLSEVSRTPLARDPVGGPALSQIASNLPQPPNLKFTVILVSTSVGTPFNR